MNTNVKSKFIKLHSIPDVQAFVNAATRVEGDIEVHRGRWCVDAKSLLGMFSVDASDGITVVYPSTDAAFEEFISQYEG